MENEATPSGAPVDVHSRLVNFLGGDEPTENEQKPAQAKPKAQAKEAPKQAPKQKAAPKEAQEEPEEAAGEVEEPEEVEEAAEEAEESETEAEETEEAPKPKTLKQLAESLGMEYDEFLDSVAAETKIDGLDGQAPLKQLIKNFQLEGSLNRKLMEHAEQKKALDQQVQQYRQTLEADVTTLKNHFQLAEKMLFDEFQNIDWNTLEQTDPTEYLRLRTRFQDRHQALGQALQYIGTQEQQKQLEQSQKFNAFVAEEAKKLSNSVPEWKDAEVMKKDKSALKEYLKSHGYSDEEVGQVYDHRHVLILRDAMRYRDLQNKKLMVTKKVVEAPKLQKPGAKKSNSDIESATFNEQRKLLKKTGKVPKGLLERFV